MSTLQGSAAEDKACKYLKALPFDVEITALGVASSTL